MAKSRRQNTNTQQKTDSTVYTTAGFFVPSKVETTKFIRPGNFNQKQYVKSMLTNTVTIATGAAGVGKSLLALHSAIGLMNHPDSPIERIVYVRANLGIKDEESLGAMPGEMEDKTAHLTYPVRDNLCEFMQKGQVDALFEYEKITVLPVSYLRGRSLANTFVIVDESQNLRMKSIKAALTRISHGSKLALIGDTDQSDLPDLDRAFELTASRLDALDDVGVIRFVRDDIMRHPLLKDMLERLDGL